MTPLIREKFHVIGWRRGAEALPRRSNPHRFRFPCGLPVMTFPKRVRFSLFALSGASLIGLLAWRAGRDEVPPPSLPTISHASSAGAGAPSVAIDPAYRYEATPLGRPRVGHPVITHVAVADLDQDGLLDVVVCDALAHTVSWIRQSSRGVFAEETVADILGPAHASVCDFNGDGRPDLLVASMNVILPNNDRIGSVVVLENTGSGRFEKHVLAQTIARVTDVRGADLNGDGRIDLVVGQFGYNEGEIRWMENHGDWNFESHLLLQKPGTIHTPVADFNQDGRPDFAALVSQDEEEIHLFTNLGTGQFRDEVLWKAADPSWNSSGLEVCDLDRDGDPDLLYSNGDGFNEAFMGAAQWHGLQWLENDGHGRFTYHRIGDMTGCYSPIGIDLDGDGDIDIATVSGFNNANQVDAVWLMAWINDGAQHFTPVPLAKEPTHLITVAAGDLDGNGTPVLVTGGFHLFPPFPSMSRVTLWRRAPR